jgi:glyoxylase-like metal-dependent hydrolase (beta-lactamase superfamily II)
MFGLPLEQPPAPEEKLTDGQIIKVGHVPLQVIHTPGHCPGHVCLWCEPHGFLIAGDLLFAGSVGRTDFPMSDSSQMRTSLKRILELPDHTKVPAPTAHPLKSRFVHAHHPKT